MRCRGVFESVFCSFHSSVSEIEARLPRSQLLALCRNEAVLKWMSTCDHLMYQALVEILIPDVLRPIPSETRLQTTLEFTHLCSYHWCHNRVLFCLTQVP